MRPYFAIAFVAVLVGVNVLSGCKSAESKASKTIAANPSPTQDASQPVDDIQRISIAEAKAQFESGKAVIIDVRGEPVYKLGHIRGSSQIPMNEIAAQASELPKDKTIILYCSCPAEHSSVAAAQILKAKGIDNTAALVGGYPAWQAAGYPIEGSANSNQ